MDYEIEEQQLEAIKKWWKENSTNIIGGIVLGAAAIFGWRYYGDVQSNHMLQASSIYEQVKTSAINNAELDKQQVRVNDLMAEYADTPYASLSAFAFTKQLLQNNDIVKAQQQLDWVIQHADEESFKVIARLRQARLFFMAKQYDQALTLLSIEYPLSFAALYEELKGDIYLAQGKQAEARAAYEKASLVVNDNKASKWLRLKQDEASANNKAEPSA